MRKSHELSPVEQTKDFMETHDELLNLRKRIETVEYELSLLRGREQAG